MQTLETGSGGIEMSMDRAARAVRGAMETIPAGQPAEAHDRGPEDALEVIFGMTVALSRAQSPKEIYDLALGGVLRVLRADRAAILLFDAADVMRFRASIGLSPEYQAAVEGHSPWTPQSSDPRPIVLEDVTLAPCVAVYREALAREGVRAISFLPLLSPTGLIGKFMIYWDAPRCLTEQEVRIAQTIAGHVAIMIQRAEAAQALRDSEARLREAQTIAHVGSFHWDARSGAVSWSDELFRLYEREPGAFVPSFDSYIACVHEEDRAGLLEALQACMREGGSFAREYRAVMQARGVRWMYARVRAHRSPSGELLGLGGTCQDITEQKRAELAIRELEGQVRQAQKMEALGRLSGGIAHDFNNILAIILGNIDVAEMDLEPVHPALEGLAGAKRACERAQSLVRQILSFSRRQPMERRVASLAPMIEEAVRFMRPILPARIELSWRSEADAPDVLADATQIHQVLVNLCTNAWHAMETGVGRIDIQLRRASLGGPGDPAMADVQPGSFACLTMSDTGSGMDTATLDRIFEPFFTTKPVGQGTGLGLSVVHGIVQAHEGAIRVDSQPGKGTSVQLYFPARQQAAAAIAPKVVSGPRGKGQRILYLDDEVFLVDLMRTLFQRAGYEVTGHTSPEKALQSILEGRDRPDLIITDLNMPTLSGLQFADLVQKQLPDLPIALISGHVTEDLLAEARRAGVRQVLYKPLKNQELLEHVARLLADRRDAKSGSES